MMTRIDLPPERKVGHLTLIREARSISPKEFNALSRNERLEIIRRAHGKQKYDLIIEACDFDELISRLPAQEVYLLVKELGFEAVPDLLAQMSAFQITACLDLDAWQGDSLDAKSVLPWLVPLLARPDEEAARSLYDLDFPLLVMALKSLMTVTAGPEDIEDEDARIEAIRRDGGYAVEFPDPEDAKAIGALLALLFRQDEGFFHQLLEAVRYESRALLEEEVYQQRCRRLEDLGFPGPFEALSVYRWLDPQTFDPRSEQKVEFAPGEEGVTPPGFLLTLARSRDFFAEVLSDGLLPAELWELTYLVNKVLIADRVDVGDAEAVQQSAEGVYHTLNLALEYFAESDVVAAREMLMSCYMEHLFRVGFSVTLQLQRRAGQIASCPIAPYLDGPFRALVEALRRRKPCFFRGIESADQGGERPFATLREVRMTEQWLDRLDVQRQLFIEAFPFAPASPESFELEGCIPDTGADLALSDVFLTALANRILGRTFDPVPIPSEELVALHGRISVDGHLDADLRRETVAWLDSLVAGAGVFGDYCLDVWEEEFCAIPPDELDPRYLGGLIVRLT